MTKHLSLEKAFYRWVTGDWSTPKLWRWAQKFYPENGWEKLMEMERDFKARKTVQCEIVLGSGERCPNEATHKHKGYKLCEKHYQDTLKIWKSVKQIPTTF